MKVERSLAEKSKENKEASAPKTRQNADLFSNLLLALDNETNLRLSEEASLEICLCF